jgi:hypothetical protein
MQTNTRGRPKTDRTWSQGKVDPKREHLAICYGDSRVPVALVARENLNTFTVEFLTGRRVSDAMLARISQHVRRELDWYLIQCVSPDAWAFAQYHCDTPANMSSPVHWSWHPKS